MGLYAKIDKQRYNYQEVVSINKSLSKQNFYLVILVFLLFVFKVFVIIMRNIEAIHNPIAFSFGWYVIYSYLFLQYYLPLYLLLVQRLLLD